MILFVKHISIEGPGTIGDFFKKKDIDLNILELQDGDKFPDDLSKIDGIVVLGGPMNVYAVDINPFLQEEDVFLRKVLKEEIPLLGICLGSQLIAKASEAEVTKSQEKEIGWGKVSLTDEGQRDPLFEGLNDSLSVFQWHEDTFGLPSSGRLLAWGKKCRNQAFKIGKNAYGLQFHIEVTQEIIESWIRKYFKIDNIATSSEGQNILRQYEEIKTIFDQQATKMYENFFQIINESRKQKVV